MERAAAEGCETRAENDSGIDQIGFGHDALTQAAHGLVQHGQDETVLKRLIGGPGPALLLPGLAVFPGIEALAALASDVPLLDHLAGLDGRSDFDHVLQLLGYRKGDVQTYRVSQLGGSHGHAEILRRAVDGFQGNPVVPGSQGAHHVRRQDAIDEKSRATADRYGQLAHGPHRRKRTFARFFARVFRGNDFHQRHPCDGIEEMKADQA